MGRGPPRRHAAPDDDDARPLCLCALHELGHGYAFGLPLFASLLPIVRTTGARRLENFHGEVDSRSAPEVFLALAARAATKFFEKPERKPIKLAAARRCSRAF